MPVCAIVSFRLGGTDGVSVVAASWAEAIAAMGFEVVTVAGEGPVDRCVPRLAIGAFADGRASVEGPDSAGPGAIAELEDEVGTALADADVVVVENLGTIPMNLPASRSVARALQGRYCVSSKLLPQNLQLGKRCPFALNSLQLLKVASILNLVEGASSYLCLHEPQQQSEGKKSLSVAS